jgi:hypothetical protein
MQKSRGVAGFRHHKESTYITLDSQERHFIKLGKANSPYLIESNGWVKLVERHNNKTVIKLKSNVDLEATFYVPKGCNIEPNGLFNVKKIKNNISFLTSQQRGAEIVFKCQ